MTTASVQEQLTRQAALQQAQRTRFASHAERLGRTARVDQDPLGRITFISSAEPYAAHEALGVHADWRGPTKLVHGPHGPQQVIEFLLPASCFGHAQFAVAGDEGRHAELLRRALFRAARKILAEPHAVHRANGLTAAVLRAWIERDDRAVAVDEDGNLRLSIGHGGFDGQTCIECHPERLQLRMTLGDWPSLPPAVEAAMLHLAGEANARTRLLRVAWREQDARRRCEAQVDLTGTPWVGDENLCAEPVARHAVLAALSGLELAARRLGRELTALADPVNRGLVDALNERAAAAPWWGGPTTMHEAGDGGVSAAQGVGVF